jgi:hypothetical protein
MNNIGFKIINLKIEQWALFEEHYDSKNENIAINTNVQIKINDKNNQIGIFLTIQIEQNNQMLIKAQTSNHFEIENTKWDALKNENTIIVPKDFAAHLAMISVGTMRGVLVAKTEQTTLAKLILPTLNVQKMFENDVVFNLK